MFGLGGKKTRKRVLELRRPVTVPREICSLRRMNDDKDGDDRKQSRLASSAPSPHPPAEELRSNPVVRGRHGDFRHLTKLDLRKLGLIGVK